MADDVYMENMTRLPSETFRLNEQFDLMTKYASHPPRNMGYILHPSLNLPPSPRIADIGTGTARFIICLHPQIPAATFEGIDISPDLFQQDGLPAGATLSVLDLKQPFPVHMHEKYDVVHLRLLVSAMRPEDWGPAVRNVFRIVRPGGYVQWEECDFISATWQRSRPDARFETMETVGEAFRDVLRLQFEHGWNTLPAQMREAGFTPVISDVVPSDRFPEPRASMTSSILSLVFTWARMMTEKGAVGPLYGDHIEKLELAVRDEIASGGYFRFNIHVACGQKPAS
ncbi:S-adenosyl-L-methionine-dependent methyltransferase [Xylariaceae sp. FL1272]|nr:S-adenosyl-L-methionine-dependent methyltransferase [Xylariaceae sp. FL1272]